MRVLLVEDNEVNRRLVREVLGHKGHEVVEAVDASQAIEALGREPSPDVLLLDIDIPGGGLTVAAHVGRTPALSGLTVIALTALAMRGDRERFLAAGCHGYIAKPISVRTFLKEIDAICAGRHD